MFSFLTPKKRAENPVHIDIHSHLLPGLDDGVESYEDTVAILKVFESLGYDKVITTPHIMSDFYKNSPQTILPALAKTREYIQDKTSIQLFAAAEYYLDETFISLLEQKEDLLTLGNAYLLFETSFMAEPVYLKEAIFKIQSRGLKPVLAHPERYQYLHNNWDLVEDLQNRGTFFQLNLNSISGYYSPAVKKMAKKLINSQFIHFFGSDCHHPAHMEVFEKSLKEPIFDKLAKLDLLNNSLV